MSKSIVEQLEIADLEMEIACADLVMQCELLIANINAMRQVNGLVVVSREAFPQPLPDHVEPLYSEVSK